MLILSDLMTQKAGLSAIGIWTGAKPFGRLLRREAVGPERREAFLSSLTSTHIIKLHCPLPLSVLFHDGYRVIFLRERPSNQTHNLTT
jgi:hypothetical protein